jgi:acetyltransferase
LFGLGGTLVEVFEDRVIGLPPLNSTLARRMMEQTSIYNALQGIRGRIPVDLRALEQLLVNFSYLVVEQPRIREIDINPVLASSDALIALDGRVILHDPDLSRKHLPGTAIRPYPSHYIVHWKTRKGTPVTLRPIRPEDEPWMVTFHQTLSEQSVYYRYFTPLKLAERVAHERLTRICFNDYDREIALVADHETAPGKHEILGVGRLSKIHGVNEAEFAIIISDVWQRQGLGTEFLKLLLRIGRDEKLDRLSAHILPENVHMLSICTKLGFQAHHELGDPEYFVEVEL